MDSGQPLRGFQNDELIYFKRIQEFLGFLAGREAAYFDIFRIVLGRAWRTKCGEFISILCNNVSEVFAMKRRHIARAAERPGLRTG
jgi:hypothetical protein